MVVIASDSCLLYCLGGLLQLVSQRIDLLLQFLDYHFVLFYHFVGPGQLFSLVTNGLLMLFVQLLILGCHLLRIDCHLFILDFQLLMLDCQLLIFYFQLLILSCQLFLI